MNSHGESSWEGQKANCVCSGLVGSEGDPLVSCAVDPTYGKLRAFTDSFWITTSSKYGDGGDFFLLFSPPAIFFQN